MASGKTIVSAELQTLSGFPVFDTDQLIEARTGKSIIDIFSTHGELYFRTLEMSICQSLEKTSDSIISTGGGMIMSPTNQIALKALGPIFLLWPSFKTIAKRLESDIERPLNQSIDELQSLWKSRKDVYLNTATHCINTEDLNPTDIAKQIWSLYKGSL